MCYLDYEPCAVWDVTTPRARKAHRCGCCGSPIAIGEQYTRVFTVTDGDAATGKSCAACWVDIQQFAVAHEGMTPFPTEMIQTLADCIADGDEESERQWKPMLAAIKQRKTTEPPTC